MVRTNAEIAGDSRGLREGNDFAVIRHVADEEIGAILIDAVKRRTEDAVEYFVPGVHRGFRRARRHVHPSAGTGALKRRKYASTLHGTQDLFRVRIGRLDRLLEHVDGLLMGDESRVPVTAGSARERAYYVMAHSIPRPERKSEWLFPVVVTTAGQRMFASLIIPTMRLSSSDLSLIVFASALALRRRRS